MSVVVGAGAVVVGVLLDPHAAVARSRNIVGRNRVDVRMKISS
jgi:acetyltransferase-like isoleucine patch superfamily enzyme